MKYDETGREKLFKSDKTRDSPSPFIKRSQVVAEFAKIRFPDVLVWVGPEGFLAPQTYSECTLAAPSSIIHLRIIYSMSSKNVSFSVSSTTTFSASSIGHGA